MIERGISLTESEFGRKKCSFRNKNGTFVNDGKAISFKIDYRKCQKSRAVVN